MIFWGFNQTFLVIDTHSLYFDQILKRLRKIAVGLKTRRQEKRETNIVISQMKIIYEKNT